MQGSPRSVLVNGLVAGLLAGLAVAAWFLVVDVAAGAPLRTPRMLGEAFFGDGGAALLGYTALHLATFAALGAAAAAFLAASGIPPGWFVGLVFGVGALNAVHYGALLALDAGLMDLLPWEHVLGANLLAGLVAMTWLHRRAPEGRSIGPAALRRRPLAMQGLAVGLVGAGAVALWFFLLDIAAGVPFRTPAALGSALFLGAESPAEIRVDLGIVAGYTVLHVALFWLVGIGLAAIARGLERAPGLAYLVILGAIILEAASFGALVVAAQWVLGALSLWAVGVGNLLAVAAMGAWIWWSRPELRREVGRRGMESAA